MNKNRIFHSYQSSILVILFFVTNIGCDLQNHIDSLNNEQEILFSNPQSTKCLNKAFFQKAPPFTSSHDIVSFRLEDNRILFPLNEENLPLDELQNNQLVFLNFEGEVNLNEVHRIGISATITCLSIEKTDH